MPSIVVGIPVRYIHAHVGVAHLDDYENGVKLLTALTSTLNEEVLRRLQYTY